MRIAALLVVVSSGTSLVACAGSSSARHDAPVFATTDLASSAPGGDDEPSSAPVATRPPGPMTRAEIEALVARGLGVFLARVDVSPVLDSAHHFVGFRLERADDLAEWNAGGADVQLGDVIVRVNGIRIEHPEQALWAFERLRIAHAIDVDLIRNGTALTVHSPIIEPVAQSASRD